MKKGIESQYFGKIRQKMEFCCTRGLSVYVVSLCVYRQMHLSWGRHSPSLRYMAGQIAYRLDSVPVLLSSWHPCAVHNLHNLR